MTGMMGKQCSVAEKRKAGEMNESDSDSDDNNDTSNNNRGDEYYDRINSRMREVFPDSFEDTEQAVAESEEPRKSAEVVAPATRNNGARPKKVKLTATQVSLARKLGITPEQYAAQLVKDR